MTTTKRYLSWPRKRSEKGQRVFWAEGETWMEGVGQAPGGISYEVTACILHCSEHRRSNISSKEFILYGIILDFCLKILTVKY